MKPILIVACLGLYISGCHPNRDEINNSPVQAYVPVYAQPTSAGAINIADAQATEKPGKIYAFGNYIFQNDLYKGIHIIDNSNAAHPHKIAFLQIPFNTDFAVKGNYIYANNINDLIVIDMHDVTHPAVTKRIKNAFPLINQEYPPQNGYFVCPDPSKGIVVDWELQNVTNPLCYH